MSDERYPVGKFQRQEKLTPAERRTLIDQIVAAPARMREAVAGLDERQLATPDREGGWSVRQVGHHVPDSHLTANIRSNLWWTKDTPTIKPYDQTRWAELADARESPIETSLQLLES